MTKPIIQLRHINVDFPHQNNVIHAVKDASLNIDPGDIYGIVGYSGAGKSTLVRVIDRLQKPSSGQVIINGQDVLQFNHRQMRAVRKKIGVIFQHYNLMTSRTILNNVEFPLLDQKLSRKERQQRAHKLLKLVGLDSKSSFYPDQLSGGQKQRVAIARALANQPKILISDEATSALDPRNTQEILHLLKDLSKKFHLTVLLITHEMDAVKAICNKVAFMDAGQIIEHGTLFDVFGKPKHAKTVQFITRNSPLARAVKHLKAKLKKLGSHQKLLLLKYYGTNVNQPLIINLYQKFTVIANVLYGNIEEIQHIPIGHLVVTLNGESDHVQQAEQYCEKLKISVKHLN
ncbi:methionine ABC transporter ATP-binding protein [Acetilactobacillus jinshanensis]|uniref:Methionine ABC transporter ATP-binding protein n=1 Tax=Acetilactobacillus jinshanensis TaxID=1720083 RepID=A0A4P6ZK49_9LACO|nr:methionine ABC transporter ATP-binding protein [Acetilactobacillus jinshanensis]QBP18141.1 methionine ABC transporter ATP-binding protein [Acetilactobacillus jinshanensis]URL61007.1 methionine ABC transporter ATP-binding protein [uncultured bacterium]